MNCRGHISSGAYPEDGKEETHEVLHTHDESVLIDDLSDLVGGYPVVGIHAGRRVVVDVVLDGSSVIGSDKLETRHCNGLKRLRK